MRVIFLIFFAIFAFGADIFEASAGLKYNEEKAQLGKKLFFDKRISPNETFSCESCHNLYWDFSGSIRKNVTQNTINPPSILNTARSFLLSKDGVITDIKKQLEISIVSKEQLGADPDDLIKRISRISEYRVGFENVYNDGITFDNMLDSLVQFVRAVYTANSRFDKYLMGDKTALSKDEIKGMELFQDVGCVACHNGINLGTNLRQRTNFYNSVFDEQETSSVKLSTKLVVRTPSLRNIARTAPYLYNGSVPSLKEAIGHVSQLQLMRKFSNEELEYIYKFLLSLNGELPRILQ